MFTNFSEHCNFHRLSVDIEKVVAFWKKAIEMRRKHSCYDFEALTTKPGLPVCPGSEHGGRVGNALSEPWLVAYARVDALGANFGPGSYNSTIRIVYQAFKYRENREFRRCIDISKYAYQIDKTPVEQLNNPYYVPFSLYILVYRVFVRSTARNLCRIEFNEVFEVLQMATYKLNVGRCDRNRTFTGTFQSDERLTFRTFILNLIKIITELDKNEDQLLKFKKLFIVCSAQNQKLRREKRSFTFQWSIVYLRGYLFANSLALLSWSCW